MALITSRNVDLKELDEFKWSEPKQFSITSDVFENSLPDRNYYIRCQNLVVVYIWLSPKVALKKGTKYVATTDLPKPTEYHASVGLFDLQFMPSAFFISPRKELRVYPNDAITAGNSFIAQITYLTNE